MRASANGLLPGRRERSADLLGAYDAPMVSVSIGVGSGPQIGIQKGSHRGISLLHIEERARHRKSGASCRTSRTRSPRGRASEYGNLLISPIFFKNAVVFFNIVVRGREPIPEPDGGELAGDKEARKHAEMIAQEMLSNRSRYKRGLEHWAFVVTDEAGRQVAVVPFSDRSRIRTSSKSK
jgi:hypothetical protein